MAKALYFYLPLEVQVLEKRVALVQEEFDEYLDELFSEEELSGFETKLDELAAVYVQPIISEMSFEDFCPNEEAEERQRLFFETCKSSICLENLPDLHLNAFQVTYLERLLGPFSEVLVDSGGMEELCFKENFLQELGRLKSVEDLISSPLEKPREVRPSRAVFPIDFLVGDVYQELDRLRFHYRISDLEGKAEELSEKPRRILNVMLKERADADSLLRASGLGPKDFGDGVERLKFFLRKI